MMWLHQFPTADCRLAKNVSHEAAKPRGRLLRYTGVLTTDFK
jgi:hypothetical protein